MVDNVTVKSTNLKSYVENVLNLITGPRAKSTLNQELRTKIPDALKKGVNKSLKESFPKTTKGHPRTFGQNAKVHITTGGGGVGKPTQYNVEVSSPASKWLPFRDEGGSTGGVIKAKKKFLAIPTDYAKKIGIKSPEELRSKKTFLLNKSGNLIVMLEPNNKNSPPRGVFYLQKSVFLKPTNWSTKGIDYSLNDIRDAISKAAEKLTKKAGGS